MGECLQLEVGVFHKMLPFQLSNVGKAVQPEDSKNTTLIWIKYTDFIHAKIV